MSQATSFTDGSYATSSAISDNRLPAACDWSKRLFWPAVGLWLVVTAWLCGTRVFSPDEYEALHQGWLLFSGALQYRDFNSNHPPLLFELLSWLNFLTDDAVTLIRLGRAIAWIASAIVATLLYRITRVVYDDGAARWAVIMYALSAMMWEWTIEIRTDALMVPMWLAAVALLLADGRMPPRRTLFWVGLLLGTAFWTNQKVVLHSVPLGLYILLGGPRRKWKWPGILVALTGSLIPTAFFVGRAAMLGSLAELLQDNLFGGVALVIADPYSKFRIFTLVNLITRDPGLVVVVVLAFIWAIGRLRQSSRNQQFVTAGALWMMATFLWTPGPFGYYLMGVFPLVLVTAGGFLAQRLVSADIPERRQARLPVTAAVYVVFPLLWLAFYLAPTNAYQCRAIRLAAAMTDPDSRVFDFSGCLVSRPDAYRFHTRVTVAEVPQLHDQLVSLIPELRESGCRLMIRTDRVRNWRIQKDRDVLQRQFTQLWGPLYVPGYDSVDEVGSEPIEFELWYDGVYETDTPGLAVDGRPVTGPIKLAAGRHTASIDAPPQRFWLRDAAYRSRVSLPQDNPDERLFLYKYWIDRRLIQF